MQENVTIVPDVSERSRAVVRAGFIGIATNLVLVAFKTAIGVLTHSIAITNDAINNLTDAGSAFITIVGTKLSMKPADRDHPFGHGRVEYLTTIMIGLIVGGVGVSSLVESVRGILNPVTPTYPPVSLLIIAAATLVKVFLGIYYRSESVRLDSDTLKAAAADSLTDSLLSLSTLVAAFSYLVFNVSIEAWVAGLIALIIIKTAWEILSDALDEILGTRIDKDLARDIKETVSSIEGVQGAYDLLLIDFGPRRLSGSVHIEVDENLSAHEIDRISRKIVEQVFTKHQVYLHTIGIYCTNSVESSDLTKIHEALDEILITSPYVLEIHGLYLEEATRTVTFDTVISFEAKNREAERDAVVQKIAERFPDYTFVGLLDTDFTG